MDAGILDLIKTIGGVVLSTGGALGLYLIFRRIDADIQKALREDVAALRKENRDLRADLRKAEGRDEEEGEQ
ncbi:hypothetical protein AU252_19720 [Pseudarthrobacter sulfonivorans]|uniref:Uncharacterized protein n=1 Tax=Pseudarthrobacter sulfonivorans TaxID=121292 RepID=A0A0U3GVE3_9MICC|nr:hypothetical protein [Pseudarthrobacter sulfonivorans]ALV43110.1 hypothetical protein AU252_19720 [Pseudarthrobacter sulfonivorans]